VPRLVLAVFRATPLAAIDELPAVGLDVVPVLP
jgi:hypothetical protein